MPRREAKIPAPHLLRQLHADQQAITRLLADRPSLYDRWLLLMQQRVRRFVLRRYDPAGTLRQPPPAPNDPPMAAPAFERGDLPVARRAAPPTNALGQVNPRSLDRLVSVHLLNSAPYRAVHGYERRCVQNVAEAVQLCHEAADVEQDLRERIARTCGEDAAHYAEAAIAAVARGAGLVGA